MMRYREFVGTDPRAAAWWEMVKTGRAAWVNDVGHRVHPLFNDRCQGYYEMSYLPPAVDGY